MRSYRTAMETQLPGTTTSASSPEPTDRAYHTVPTRFGSNTSSRTTFPMMKKKPSSVTMFGASHSGSNSTTAFHYSKRYISSILFLRTCRLVLVHSVSECTEILEICRRKNICRTGGEREPLLRYSRHQLYQSDVSFGYNVRVAVGSAC